MSTQDKNDSLCSEGCGCRPKVSRRRFMKASTAAAAGAGVFSYMAGPFADENEYLRMIAEDKRLNPAWIRALYDRGIKQTYSEPAALQHIGMPAGGLFAGTLYLAGDGRLWLWNIFNRDEEGIVPRTISYHGEELNTRAGANFLEPAVPASPFSQGFTLRAGRAVYRMDQSGFPEITFDGRYPIARISYRNPSCPVHAELEAFSPFIPLNAADSSLPCTVMSYTVTNGSAESVDCALGGWLENPVCLYHRDAAEGKRVNRIVRGDKRTQLVCSVAAPDAPAAAVRPDVVFADFESKTYEGWTAEGTAFGNGPIANEERPSYQGELNGVGERVVNSHASAPGGDVRARDSQVGKLTSAPFEIVRDYICLRVGGGAHEGQTCINLVVDGEIVASVTGKNNNKMAPASMAVKAYAGKRAHLEIVDQATAAWGNIGVDHIVFSDTPANPLPPLEELYDFGTMTLMLLEAGEDVVTNAETDENGRMDPVSDEASAALNENLIGGVAKVFTLAPGESKSISFVLAWHFPNFYGRGLDGARVGHSYGARFANAAAVADYVGEHFERLASATRKWVDTWYDSSLPYWLLDRTMANTAILATTTCYRFESGRFWAWEGIGCCQGTCTHVWHYAQAPGRLFPEIERGQREGVDFGISQHEDGGIGMRAKLDSANHAAHDGQCGRILGVLREHQMSKDSAFLENIWPRVKKALNFLITLDGNADGMIEGPQPNTLDAAWYGKISFLSSLYIAALRAGETMAREVGDHSFAAQCGTIAARGAESILETYNGEYFMQLVDPEHADAIGSGVGCYIDQVFGQTWAHWTGLGRLFDRDKQLSALRALYKYNFVPDVGPFREQFKLGRWYAAAGDAGLLMCTWPRGGKHPDAETHWQFKYFNECMTGFEWQAAAHMIWEGIDQPDVLEHGLAVARAIYDRYDAALRNPYNEIECSDHYSRSMASYGAFQAACGYTCHGPSGHLAFAPRIGADNFRAAFTVPEGWGSISQRREGNRQTQRVEVKHGTLRLRSLGLRTPTDTIAGDPVARIGEREISAACSADGPDAVVTLGKEVVLKEGDAIEVRVTCV